MTIDELKSFCNEEFKNIDAIADEIFSVYKPEKTKYTLADRRQ